MVSMVRWLILALAMCIGMAHSQEPAQAPSAASENPIKEVAPEQPKPEALQSAPAQVMPQAGVRNVPEPAMKVGGEGTEFWPSVYGYRLKVSDTVLMAFTVLLFAASVFLYTATRKLVTGAEEKTQKELRAYIGMDNVFLRGPTLGVLSQARLPDPPNTVDDRIVVRVKNYGRTPAYNAKVWVDWQAVAPYGNPPSVLLPNDFFEKSIAGLKENAPEIISQRVINAEQLHTVSFKASDLAEIAAAHRGEGSFYVWGHVQYTDAFAKKWRTNFCCLWQPKSPEPYHWVLYKEHNDEHYLGEEKNNVFGPL